MNFDFSLFQLFKVSQPAIIIISPDTLSRYSRDELGKVDQILTAMGTASQKAQGLPQVITSLSYVTLHQHTVILLIEERAALGIHKVGSKHLFQYDSNGRVCELAAFCCLDFYVHESQQRRGLGLLMFRVAEQFSGIRAGFWAFDKPSPKLFAFLKKHYSMDLRAGFTTQVSKYAMAEGAILRLGAAFARLRTNQKLTRSSAGDPDCMDLVDQIPPEGTQPRTAARVIQLKTMSLDEFVGTQPEQDSKQAVRSSQVEQVPEQKNDQKMTVDQLRPSRPGVKTGFW